MRTLAARAWRILKGPEGGPAVVETAPTVPLREVFRRFWPYARPYRHWIWVALLFVLIGPILETATIWIFKVLVDEVLVPKNFEPFAWIAAAYLALALFGAVVSFIEHYLSTWVSQSFLLSMRTDFFRHLQGLSLDFFERRQLGDIMSRLGGDIGSIEDLMLSDVTKALGNALRIIFFAGMLFYLRWELALVGLLVTPLFVFAARHFSRLLKQASRELRRRVGSISAVAQESLANVVLVQAYNRQEREIERYQRQNLGSFAIKMMTIRLKALFGPLVDFSELLGVLVVVGVGTWELAQGRLTLGGLMAFLAYLNRLYRPVRGLTSLTNSVFTASAGAERVIEFLDQRPSITDRDDASVLGRAQGLVVLDEVSFCYPESTRNAIDRVSFSISPGETLALVGPSGAGKSTIAKLLLRFYDPSVGRILLDGYDLRELRLSSLRDNVAVLLQDTLVFHGTVRENIAYGRLEATEEEIVEVAKLADAHDFIEALPEGYDTVIGHRGQRLSGGQRQRIAIARAMIRNAPLLILDEPTTGLDAASGRRILEALRRLMRGRTTIIISHNLMTVREATAIAVLEGGRIVERGTHAELLGLEGAYARLYRLHNPDGAIPVVSGAQSRLGQAVEAGDLIDDK